MAKKKLVVEILFEEVQDEFEDDYTYLEFDSMRMDQEASTVSPHELDAVAEGWGQSDWYSVGFNNAFLRVLDGVEVKADQMRY